MKCREQNVNKLLLATLCALGVAAGGCATLNIGRPPESPPTVPRPPAVPEAVVDGAPTPEAQSHEIAARAVPSLRSQSVAISGRRAVTAPLFDVVPRTFVAASATNFMIAPHIVGERRPFEHAPFAADYLLYVDDVSLSDRSVSVAYHVPPDALSRYTTAHAEFVRALRAYRTRLASDTTDYVQRFRAEVERLNLRSERLQTAGAAAAQAGAGATELGIYEQITADVTRLSAADQETFNAAQSYVNSVLRDTAEATALARDVPTPDALATGATSRPPSASGVMYTARVHALLTDLRSGETIASTDITAEGRTRTEAFEAAARRLTQVWWRGGGSAALAGPGEQPTQSDAGRVESAAPRRRAATATVGPAQ